MAMAIDTLPLAQAFIPRLQRYLDEYTGRFQIHRVCAHATVIHHETAFKRLLVGRDRLAEQAALDWQAEQGDDLQDGEVFHHLQQQVVTSPLLSKAFSHTERTTSTTTLVASALSPSFRSRTNGRPVSSFSRKSLRCSCLQRNDVLAHAFAFSSDIPDVFPSAGKHYAWVYFPEKDLKIVWENQTGYKPFVVWNLQLDVVDLDSRITTYARPEKRLRTAGSLLLHALEFEAAAAGHDNNPPLPPGRRKFRGVRHRPDRKGWVAEMKPPKSKNKVSFGDFKTEIQAARAVDAAFHHYGKPHLLNFPDSTPRILASKPTGHGLDEKAKLKLAKEQAKWLASIATTLASNSAPSNSSPDSGCSAVALRSFRSFSELSSMFSSGGHEIDEEDADDGTGTSMETRENPKGIIPWSSGFSAPGSPGTSIETYLNDAISQLEGPVAEVGAVSCIPSTGNFIETRENRYPEGILPWSFGLSAQGSPGTSIETFLNDIISQLEGPAVAEEDVVPCIHSTGNSMETYNPAEFSTEMLRRLVDSSRSCMEFLVMSPPPPPMLYMATSSSSDSEGNVIAGHLWEPQSLGCI